MLGEGNTVHYGEDIRGTINVMAQGLAQGKKESGCALEAVPVQQAI